MHMKTTILALAATAFASLASAQVTAPRTVPSPRPVQTAAMTPATPEPITTSDTVSVSYVMVPFTAIGHQGVPLTDLRSRDVKLLVDGIPVRTDLFEKSMNAPVSFTILVDASGSMALGGKMAAARAALTTMIARRQPGDEFSLYVFADDEAHELVPFTKNITTVLRAFDTIKPYGKTAFFDAISTMPERSELGSNPSRAIILLSDGIDNASKLTREQLARLLEGISVPIYPLGLREPAEQEADKPTEEGSDIRVLREVAEITGGHFNLGYSPDALSAAVTSIERDLRAQYLVGFSPTGSGTVKYRRISLQLAGRVRTVRVRAGYKGTEPPSLSATSRGKSKRNDKKGT